MVIIELGHLAPASGPGADRATEDGFQPTFLRELRTPAILVNPYLHDILVPQLTPRRVTCWRTGFNPDRSPSFRSSTNSRR